MIPYEFFEVSQLSPDDEWSALTRYDLFISSYNGSERTKVSFERIAASKKVWFLLSHFEIPIDEVSGDSDAVPINCSVGEGPSIREAVNALGISEWAGVRVCVDITGFIKPWCFSLLRELVDAGVRHIDCLYTEPMRYRDGKRTKFSGEVVNEVRSVHGFEGHHSVDNNEDVLIIGAGYDYESIKHVAESKERARKVVVLGFPPLRADMYQENILQAYEAEQSLSMALQAPILAPANDPFLTAKTLSSYVRSTTYTNLYLSPLATEAQALGFALFYLLECRDKPVSILHPFCDSYPPSTSIGMARGWMYHLVMPPTA